jgi:hypothetical protein
MKMKKTYLIILCCAMLASGCARKPKYTAKQCDQLQDIMFDSKIDRGLGAKLFEDYVHNCVGYANMKSGPKHHRYIRVHKVGGSYRVSW